VLLGGTSFAHAVQKPSPLSQVQRLLPSTTVALAFVPVRETMRESLSGLLNPEQKTEALVKRLSKLSVDRVGLDVWAADTAVPFWCEGGERGLIFLGDFGARSLRNTDRRLAGLPVITMGDGVFLTKVGGALVVAPRAGIELLGRVARGDHHKLLGTRRLQAFRSGRESLRGDAVTVYAEGTWIIRSLSPRTQLSQAKSLKVVYGSCGEGRVSLHALGAPEGVQLFAGLVQEAVGVLKLQHEMLLETAEGAADFGSRLGRVLLTEVLHGLVSSVVVETQEDRMQVRFSLPRGLSLGGYTLVGALLSGSELDLPGLLKLPPATK